MLYRLLAPGALLLASGLVAMPALAQQAPVECEVDRPVVFAGLDWDSARFHNAVARHILEHGYACETDAIPGSTIPLMQGLGGGDVDVMMEIWWENVVDLWRDFADEGLVERIGVNFPDAVQGWYVPRYLVEGPDAAAPDLKSVFDLPEYKDLFRDPEEPDKGRFVNCILGWECEEINTKKLAAYGLQDDYTNFRPGTGAALASNIASNYRRKRPFLSYYWGPTWVTGSYDLIRLEEPRYDEETWERMLAADYPEEATAYPTVTVVIGANADFAEQAPGLVEFLASYETDSRLVAEALAYMQENDASPRDAAEHFLKTREDVWTKWVDDAVAERVRASLGG